MLYLNIFPPGPRAPRATSRSRAWTRCWSARRPTGPASRSRPASSCCRWCSRPARRRPGWCSWRGTCRWWRPSRPAGCQTWRWRGGPSTWSAASRPAGPRRPRRRPGRIWNKTKIGVFLKRFKVQLHSSQVNEGRHEVKDCSNSLWYPPVSGHCLTKLMICVKSSEIS